MRIILVFLIILSFSCKKENKSTFFGGKILNKSSNKIVLNKDNNLFKDALISKDGIFKMKFDSLSSGLYNFFLQPEFQYVILEKNDSLFIRLNSLDFDESLVFMGNGSSKNNFLIDVFLNFEFNEAELNKFNNKPFNDYLNIIDSLILIQKNNFNVFKSETKLSQLSEKIILSAIKYPYMDKIQSYVLRKNLDKSLWNNINDKYEINLNDGELAYFKSYIDFIYLYTFNLTRILNNNINGLDFQIERLNIIDKLIYNDKIKSKLYRFLAFEVLLKNNNITYKEKFIKNFIRISKFKLINNEVYDLYENQRKLIPGNYFPFFDFTKTNSSEINILKNNLSKKVLFFWSYDQIPHSNSIHEKINALKKIHSNFDYYSININDSQSKWINNIIDLELNNIRSLNFNNLSRKLLINNLNKVFLLNQNNQIIKIDLIDNIKL